MRSRQALNLWMECNQLLKQIGSGLIDEGEWLDLIDAIDPDSANIHANSSVEKLGDKRP